MTKRTHSPTVHTPEIIRSPGHQSGVTMTPAQPGSRLTSPPSLGYVTFVSFSDNHAADGLEFTALLGDGSPTPKGGYAGWETIDRSRRVGLTEWKGVDPLSLEIPLLFDNFADGSSIELAIRQLEKMAGLSSDINEPPLVIFDSGGVIPHDSSNASHLDWIVSDIQWGDADRNRYGNRIRQAVTLTVMEYIDDDHLSRTSAARRRRHRRRRNQHHNQARGRAHKKRYVVKGANETLETIAAHILHSAHRWREIRKLNPKFRDPKKKIPIGTILRIP